MGLKICARMTAKKQNYLFWVVIHLYITWYDYVRYYVLNWIKYKTAYATWNAENTRFRYTYYIKNNDWLGCLSYDFQQLILNNGKQHKSTTNNHHHITRKTFICVSIFVCFIVFNSVSSYKIILSYCIIFRVRIHFYSNFSILLHFETHI